MDEQDARERLAEQLQAILGGYDVPEQIIGEIVEEMLVVILAKAALFQEPMTMVYPSSAVAPCWCEEFMRQALAESWTGRQIRDTSAECGVGQWKCPTCSKTYPIAEG